MLDSRKMKAKIFGAIFGLTFLIGSLVSLLGFVDSSSLTKSVEVETSLQITSYVHVDFPAQDGNLRLQKIDIRDLRMTTNHFKNFLNNNYPFSDFDSINSIKGILSFKNSVANSLNSIPLYIRLRALIV